MTIIYKKDNFDFRNNVNNWDEVFSKREILLSFFNDNSQIVESRSIIKILKAKLKKFL